MWNFNLMKPVALWLGLAVSALGTDFFLKDGNKLTGEFMGFDENGTITLVSPVASKPLLVNVDSLVEIDFGVVEDSGNVLPDQRIELVNGDILPMEVDALQSGELNVSSEDLGALSIPEKLVSSIQLGIVPERIVYKAGRDFQGWKRDGSGGRNWSVGDNGYKVKGAGEISRTVDLPEKFIIRFVFNWSDNPRFWFHFADPLEDSRERVNRYRLEISQANLSLKRESTGAAKFTQIAIVNRSKDRFKGDAVNVELKVDRTRGAIHMYVNGELEGRYSDPVPEIPDSNGIAFVSAAPNGNSQTVANFQISEWDDRGDRHRAEERGDDQSDALIGRFGERFGGTLTGIEKGGDGAVYTFKSDFQEDAISLPEEEVSVVFLAPESAAPDVGDSNGLILNLRGGGKIQVNSCVFSGNKVSVVHPLLGQMELSRSSVISLMENPKSGAKPKGRK